MDANFLRIPIISCLDTATFQFVPLVPQAYVANVDILSPNLHMNSLLPII